MSQIKKVYLSLKSNIDNYQIIIYNDFSYAYEVIDRKCTCIYFYTYTDNIKIVATPLTNGYQEKICCNLKVNSQNCLVVKLNFPKNPVIESINTFKLIDKNYDLPIDGTLIFNIS